MISSKIRNNLKNSSWIRIMFEEGEKLRKIYGKDSVFDFSLGNPSVETPKLVKDNIKRIVEEDNEDLHRYMNNAGYSDVREKMAEYIKRSKGVDVTYKNIVMTCGAAGALNVVLKTLLDPGEEVIIFAPYFVEYLFYVDNYNGKAVISPSDVNTFEPDLINFEKSISPATKAVIINSPNNPTGVVYSAETLKKMANIIEAKQKEYGTSIFVIADEPYVNISYDGVKVPSALAIFRNCIIVNSYSKSLSLPGERIGYIAVNDNVDDMEDLINGLIFSNRILGFVNAPSLFQRVIASSADASVDIDEYRKNRDILYDNITKIGFECVKPQGAFYLFPKALIPDDVAFVKQAVKYNLLLVPGTGFGCPGYFRLSYCIDRNTIENSVSAFEKLYNDFK